MPSSHPILDPYPSRTQLISPLPSPSRLFPFRRRRRRHSLGLPPRNPFRPVRWPYFICHRISKIPLRQQINTDNGYSIFALKDILPPSTRRSISNSFSRTSSAAKAAASFGGKGIWVFSTSALLLMVPFALAFVEEQSIIEQEKEMKAQEGLREGLTPGVQGGQEGRGQGVGPSL